MYSAHHTSVSSPPIGSSTLFPWCLHGSPLIPFKLCSMSPCYWGLFWLFYLKLSLTFYTVSASWHFWSSFIFSTFPFARSTQHLPTYSLILSWLGLIPLHTFQLGETRVLVLPLPHGWQSQSLRPTARISVTSLFPWAGVQMSSNLFSEFKFHPVSPCTCFQKPFSASGAHPYFPSLICPHVRLEAAG